MEMTRNQFFTYLIIGQIIFGILVGLIPFFLGRKRGEPKLGNFGILASVVAGALSPLAAIIVAAVFSWLIVRKKGASAETTVSDIPADQS